MNVLVLAAHPDDDAIGMGGTIRKYARIGEDIAVVYLTDGAKGAGEDSPEGLATQREAEAEEACRILGVKYWTFLRKPDGELSGESKDVIGWLDEDALFKPDRIFSTSSIESHPDHVAASVIGEALAVNYNVPLLYYEIWTPFEKFDAIVDISYEMADKLAAIRAHKSQCERMDFDKAALGLARYRGTLHNRPNGPYAEAFKKAIP